jgi:hypothetical protein
MSLKIAHIGRKTLKEGRKDKQLPGERIFMCVQSIAIAPITLGKRAIW